MFPLGGKSFPTTSEQLAAAVSAGLSTVLTFPAGAAPVSLQGKYPAMNAVKIDLSGARFDQDQLPPEPRGTGQAQTGPSAAALLVVAHPILIRSAPAHLDLTAADAKFNYDRDAAGKPVLVLAGARAGQLSLQIQQADLRALILSGARDAAAKQGVQIQDVNLALTQIDSRSIAAEVRVKAKKLFLNATVAIRGTLRIDDEMNANVSGLSCTGEGMLGDMASAIIRPKLDAINGKTFPLSAISLGSVKLHDLQLEIREAVKVSAKFGSEG